MIVNNVNDWMNELATALIHRDLKTIDELDNISYSWLQSSEERGAQQNLIEAAYEVLV